MLYIMPIKYTTFIVVAAVLLAFAACESTPKKEAKKSENVEFVVKIDTNMTISELAKANRIGEPYLRTMLGMPTRAGGQLPLYQLRKNYKFSYEKLEAIISEAKNR